jgi:uncharacterized membrane protein (TIGR02234 family)
VTKRTAVLAVGGVLAAYLLACTQPWVRGTTRDAVLGSAALGGTGAQLAPGATALALVVAAGLVALASGGPRIRYAAGATIVLAGAGMLLLTLAVLGDPAGALGRRAAELAGRAGGTIAVEAAVGPAAWVGVATAGALVLVGGWAGWTARSWAGLSSRFDRADPAGSGSGSARTAGPSTAPGERRGDPRGARRSAWDELTDGTDPTTADGDPAT